MGHIGFSAEEAAAVAGALADPAYVRKGQPRPYETAPELIKAYRLVSGLTQYEVADVLGAARTILTKFEHGTTTCDPVTLVRLANVVGAPLDRVLPAAGWSA